MDPPTDSSQKEEEMEPEGDLSHLRLSDQRAVRSLSPYDKKSFDASEALREQLSTFPFGESNTFIKEKGVMFVYFFPLQKNNKPADGEAFLDIMHLITLSKPSSVIPVYVDFPDGDMLCLRIFFEF